MLLEQWHLAPDVAIRPEPFGALAYDFGTRRLTFLKRPELVSVVTGLADHADVRSALEASAVPESEWPAYVSALQALARAGTIRPRRVEALA
jgi:putative mycofactocin binding protein MftB